MTCPRLSTTRELFGILGSFPGSSQVQAQWNALFKEEGMDAFMDRYPAKPDNLPERLSEMFHFDRRGYIVAPALREAIVPLLDHVDERAVDTVWNENGVMHGYRLESPDRSSEEVMEERAHLWFEK